MVPREAYLANLYLADRALENAALIAGCIVECGTWKGGMAAGLVAIGGPKRDYHFFDSFGGLPAVTAEDGDAARRWQANAAGDPEFDNCMATPAEFLSVMARVNLPAPRLHVHEGLFSATFPAADVPPIAILRLDADWYELTRLCLERFWDGLISGALVLVDDYYTWEGCRRALHEFLAGRQAKEAVHESWFGKVAYLIKT